MAGGRRDGACPAFEQSRLSTDARANSASPAKTRSPHAVDGVGRHDPDSASISDRHPSERSTPMTREAFQQTNRLATIIRSLKSSALDARHVVQRSHRRKAWILSGMTARKALNLMLNCVGYVAGATSLPTLPSLVKADISPVCSLKCPVCLHASPEGRGKPLLAAQKFDRSDRMTANQFRHLVESFEGKTLAISLFYYGDPLAHPEVNSLCGIARSGGVNVHVTSHFSYSLSDAKVRKLADCGLTHLTVALDGSSAAIYSSTRIRGRFDWVVGNLRRIIAYRNENKRRHPFVEVQYVAHKHHPPLEAERVRALAGSCGADQFTSIPPYPIDNVVDEDPDNFDYGPARPKGALPKCHWPYTSTVVKHDGDVIPCCNYRAGQQFVADGDKRALGNVFQTPLREIWNSEAYRSIRRFVRDPSLAERDPAYRKSFCYGCPVLTERKPMARATSPSL